MHGGADAVGRAVRMLRTGAPREANARRAKVLLDVTAYRFPRQ
jgi:hypothetical protein